MHYSIHPMAPRSVPISKLEITTFMEFPTRLANMFCTEYSRMHFVRSMSLTDFSSPFLGLYLPWNIHISMNFNDLSWSHLCVCQKSRNCFFQLQKLLISNGPSNSVILLDFLVPFWLVNDMSRKVNVVTYWFLLVHRSFLSSPRTLVLFLFQHDIVLACWLDLHLSEQPKLVNEIDS